MEATTAVVMVAIDDPVLSLGLVVHGGAFRIVLAKAHARRDEGAIHFVAVESDRRHVGNRKIVGTLPKPCH